VLNIHERRTFDCVMREHQAKSGYVKDGLIVTRRDFIRGGVDPFHVTSSLAVLHNLGIIKQTRNMGGSREGRTPSMHKPTFLPSEPGLKDATHDYLEIKTAQEARRIAEMHRYKRLRKPPAVRRPKLKLVSSPSITPPSIVSGEKGTS
jgi:hypothetical protein